MSEAYIIGMTHIREAVEQLRGVAVNQVSGAEVAIVTGGPIGPAHQRHAAAQLTNDERKRTRDHGKTHAGHLPLHDEGPLRRRADAAVLGRRRRGPAWPPRGAPNCGTLVLPPQPFCFTCRGQAFEWVELPGTGTIYTFTVVRHPLAPHLADVVPYVSGVIELDGTQGAGARLLLNITDADPETVEIGDKVKIWFDKVSARRSTCPGPGWPDHPDGPTAGPRWCRRRGQGDPGVSRQRTSCVSCSTPRWS